MVTEEMDFNITSSYDFLEDTNLTYREYLEKYRGLKQQSLDVAIPLTVFNVLIFVSGFLGNLAVCIVIIKHQSLHNATNYYLFNLAISDLTLLIFGLPNDVAYYWHQYPWVLGNTFCKLRALLSEMSSYVSVLTIVAFSTERYLAICYPLYLHTMSGLQRAVRIITCLWIVAFLSALPFCMYTQVEYLDYPLGSGIKAQESAFCAMLKQPEGLPITELSALLFFIIPALAIAVQYTRMAIKISQATQKTLGKGIKGSVHRDSRKQQSNRSVIRMLSAVVLAFFICWAPFHAQRLLYIYGADSKYFQEINSYMFFITGLFYYLSSTLNPILYNVMSEKMRYAFKDVLCGVKSKRGRKSLSASSTFRDTTHTYHVRLHNSSNNIQVTTLKEEDEAQLINKEIVTVTAPKIGSKLVYEINYKAGNCTCCNGQHTETCI